MFGMPDATGRPPSRACGPAPTSSRIRLWYGPASGKTSPVEMAKIGRPVLIGVQTLETLRHRLQRYRETMLAEGFAVTAVEQALDATWARGSPWRTATTKRWRGCRGSQTVPAPSR